MIQRGVAKRTRYGDSCLAWDTPEIGFWFDSEQILGLGPLTKDNRYCRNPDEAEAPWCLVGKYVGLSTAQDFVFVSRIFCLQPP